MHDEVGFPHYLVDKKKFKKRFKKYDHVSADRKKARERRLRIEIMNIWNSYIWTAEWRNK